MNRNLLIVGAGTYGRVASEIAAEMGCFDRIDYVDDHKPVASDGRAVVGTTADLCRLSEQYGSVIVAVGNADFRLSLLKRIREEMTCRAVSLISPRAYVSPGAQVSEGCVVEPMAVIHTECRIGVGCLISAGAVVNHGATCRDGVHVNCNATVAGYMTVPERTTVPIGSVYSVTIEE